MFFLSVEERVQKIIDEVTVLDRVYFQKDRQKLIKAKIDDAVALLDSKPIE